LGSKLLSHKITPIYVGSKKSENTYSREAIKNASYRGLPIYIASATDKHLDDLKDCLELQPTKIYVEKGFLSSAEKQEASALVKSIPTYILSQHRYSIIFDQLTSGLDVDKVIKCTYNWGIERNTVSEYLYHIASLDSYLKNKNVEIYHNEYGEYIIDDISTVNISKQFQRRLKIQIETELYTGEFIITKAMNSMTMKSKRDKQKIILSSRGEDTVSKMINEIVSNEKKIRLERL
jgi:hypothetical protein